MEWKIQNLRPSGQPVIPIFDGWLEREDGSTDLCFGYFNLNLEEELEIPLGPDNFIDPPVYDGRQPTHFDEVPESYRRYFCTFTVTLPPEAASDSVVWTLRLNGQTYAVPGDASVPGYRLDGFSQPSRGVVAPIIQLLEPAAVETRGRGWVVAGPASSRVGIPLPIAVAVSGPDEESLTDPLVVWTKHQGPGSVSFSREEATLRDGQTEASTQATFDAPGEYLLRVQAVDGGRRSYGFHCCWTNVYLSVQVTP